MASSGCPACSSAFAACSVDFLVRIASTRSNPKIVSQSEHFHAIGLFWSLKTVAVRAGMAIVSHRPIQDASHVDFNCTTTAETLILSSCPCACILCPVCACVRLGSLSIDVISPLHSLTLGGDCECN